MAETKRLTATTFEWGDGEYTFDLPLKQVEQLEEETGFGVSMLLWRLQHGHHKSREPRLVIFYGLIGGGMDPVKARTLTRVWVDERPGAERDLPATAILLSWMMGAPPAKKAKAPKARNRKKATAPAG